MLWRMHSAMASLSHRLPLSHHARRVSVLSRALLQTAPTSSSSSSSSSSKHAPSTIPNAGKTAAACIIANEVLTGKVHDTNSHTLAKFCFENGIALSRIEVIPDIESEIVKSVQSLSANYDLVFTSGGIGPTHDDITYESIAKAFGLSLEYHEPTIALMKTHYSARNIQLTDPIKRMALIPSPCKIIQTEGLWVPLVVVAGNVHILPGIPTLFAKMLQAAQPALTTSVKFTRKLVFTYKLESQIADALTRASQDFPSVSIGSYPRFGDLNVRVMVSLESSDEESVRRCLAQITSSVAGFFDSEEECAKAAAARSASKK